MELSNELKNSILKTGTTILGIVCKDGVVMAADRQSTAGNIVMNKNSKKIKVLNDYVAVASTGVVSDIQRTFKVLSAELRLKRLKSRSRPTIKQAANLLSTITYSQIRQPSMVPSMVGTLLGGFDEDGEFALYTIEPAGSVIKVEDYDA
ncbi:hypothetical protein KAR52_03670, partial [Candidatus Pacearchaeota archaeon]|nr:hypothetical protein [Candidatus Pacearchaeota archaeon]